MNLKKTKRKSDKIANTAARLEIPFAVTHIVRRIRSAIGIANFPLTAHLLCSTSVGLLFATTPSYAANYTASDETSLRQAITAANADGDPSSTITLTNNIVLTSTTGFGAATKPLTIDTGSFTLSTPGMTDSTKAGTSTAVFSGGPVTVIGNGNIIGGDAAPAKSTAQGGSGLVQTGVPGGTASLTNSGTLTGGNGGSTDYEAFPSGILRITGKGGDGATATNTAIVNNAGGVMKGGIGGAYDDKQYQSGDQNAVAGVGGNGVTATGGTLVNNGTLLGGTGGKTFNWPTSGSVDNLFAGAGGAGAALDGGADIHINNGLMLGGIGGEGMNLGASGNGQGGSGLILTGGAKLQNNQGANITGGNGLAGGGFTAIYQLNPDGSKYVSPSGYYNILGSDPDPTSGSRGGSGATVTGSNLATSNLVNYGTISGGDGAAGRTSSAGGAGITGLGYANILNFAVINAGKNGDGSLGSAVEFKNGNNRLDLRTGYVINGLATAGATDWLGIGGSVDGTFDASKVGPSAQYRGFGNFEKTDGSFWTLTGETTAVTPWTLTGGILNVSSDAGLGASSGLLTFNGGTLQFANSFDMTHEVALNIPGGTVDVQNYNVTMTQRINGWGPFAKTGSGMLTLTGSLTAGGTTIKEGTLQIGNGGTTGAINNGIANYGTLIFNRSNDYTNSSSIGGTGNVIKTGAGTLTYAADATHTGGTTVDNGTLLVGNNGANNVNFGSWAGDVTVTGPGTFGYQRSDTATYAGVVSGTGKFLQAGKGTLVLSGANTYTGGTTITAGTLQVGNGATSGSIVGDVAINAASAALAFNRTDTGSLGGVISGAGKVQQAGTGTTILTGNSTYTGGTAITAGTLQIGNGGTSGSIVGNVANSGTLAFNRSDDSVFGGVISGAGSVQQIGTGTTILAATQSYTGDTTVSAGTLQIGNGTATGGLNGNGRIINNSKVVFNRSTNMNVNNVISGTGQVEQKGGRAVNILADNTYTGGTLITNGSIVIGGTSANATTGSIVGDVVTDTNGTLRFNRVNNYVFNGLISGTGGVQQTGLGGTTTLTANNTYTNGTFISAGTLELGNGGTSGSIVGDVQVIDTTGTNGSTLAFNRSDSYSFDGVIFDSGRVEQRGTGTTTLTGANTYTGTTTVKAGTLLVNGDQTAATGATSVLSGATLGGTGIIGGDVTVANGATLAPGVSGATPGTLTINGALSLNQDSILAYRYGQANVPGGALNDLTNVKGNLTLDGKINVSLTPGGTFGPGIYRVFNYGGTLTNNGLDIGTLPAGTDPGSIYVQTSVAGQVNLANTQGLTLNYWDAKGAKNNNAIDGGTGTWQNTGGLDNWANDTGTVNAPWQDNAFAIFQATPGTVTVDNSNKQVSASGMQFASDGYIVTGGPLTLGGGASSIIRVGDGTGAGAGMTATINSVLQGTTQLDKTDAGTLVLTGANTYTGGTAIDGGVLQVANDGNLGAASGGLTFNGGTLRLGSSFNLGSGRTVTLNAPGGTIDTQTFTSTLAQGMTGAGAFTKAGTGTLTLTGSNTYTGGTTISAGTLQLGSGGTTGSIVGDVANSGTLVFNRSDSTAFNGVISGAGAVQQIGTGTTTLTGANTYTGGTTITAGTLQLGNGGTAGSITGNVVDNGTLAFNRSDSIVYGGVVSGTGQLQQKGSGTTTLTGANTYTGGTTITAGTLQLGNGGTTGSIVGNVVDNGTLAFNRSDAVLFGGVVSGSGVLQQIGTGTTTLTGTNTYTGGTTITAGTLQLGNGGTSGSIVGNVANNGALVFNRSDNTAFNGVISGTGTVQKLGGNVLTLTGTNTYTGGTTITAGTLQIGNGGTNGSIVGNVANSGVLAFNRSDAVGFDGIVSGTGSLQQIGAGTTTLTGANTYTGGTTISAGTLQIGNGGTSGSIVGNVANNGALAFNRSDSIVYGGVVSGSGSLQQKGTGTTTLTGANTYTGGTTITAGTLQIGNGGTAGSILGNVTNNGTLAFNRSDDIAFGGVISGTGAVQKFGTGVLTLTGTNSYGGATSVNAGTLLVNGDQTAATGATSVLSGATLGGTGIIGGDVTVANGATLAPGVPGATPGTLTINGALALNQDSTLAYRFGEANEPGGALNDLTEVKGNLTLDGKINVSLTPGGTFGPGIYRVINYGGTLTNNGLDIGTLPAGTAPGSIYVQTSVAGQVNLANTSGLTLNYWDAKGAKNNNAVDGGTGTWQNAGGFDNWTDQGGAVNARWQDNAFAIFQATPGTVTVDNGNGNGQVSAAGMQFASDGYVVSGDALTLGGGTSSIIRVGDGTAAGAGMTATISAVLQGSTQLDKTDAGTLVLTGANTYTGGTAIDGGVLQVAGDGNLGAANSGLTFNGGTLQLGSSFDIGTGRAVVLNAPGGTIDTQTFTSMLAQGMTGAGAFTKAGTGTLTLAGANTYTGGTTISAGTLQLGNGGTSGSILGDVANSGTLVFNRADNIAFDGVISGAGTLEQRGSGTTALTGANTYTGGTTISAGTLQIGNGGTTGSILGNVANNGALAFNRSDAVSFDGIVSGSGALQQIGTGTTTLTAANTYTGGTTITTGTLQIGNGGTTGSIVGDVVDNGTLAFNRSDDIAFGGVISGTGALQKFGTSVLTLTGTNSYGGATSVNAGTLLVNGDQTAAKGATSVASGATLGGTGTIGGDVTIANGATLAPGVPGATPGTLTINGALALNQDSTLAYRFGQADVAGGARNDLTEVKGNLTLDGKINVALTPGGNFGPGTYRVFNYGGTLTDNVLDIGTLPAGTAPGSVFVQTSVSGQVNLVNTQGLQLTYWDADGARNNNKVDGGTGTWENTGSFNNWTSPTGEVNAAWAPNGFAIFQAKPGTVTVDNGNGQVSASGMQFDSDGYLVQGDALTLAGGASSIIRVGNGTSTGAGVTATISAVLQGATQLDKTDLGTLVLTGANTYTGGTAIDGGVLQVAGDGNLGAASGGLTFNGGTLQLGSSFNLGSGRTITLNAPGGTIDTQGFTSTLAQGMTGAGAFTKAGNGVLTLSAANGYTGGTTIAAGTLQVGSGGTSGSILGNVVDNGTLAFNRSDNIAFGGVVSGSGTLEQRGSGTTTLTGTNTYTGGTTISAGTLQLGNGGTVGSILGNVTNNGTLAFNRSNNITVAGIISGTGAVRQIGSGVTTLSGINSYSGGTFIDAGVLQVTADNNLGDAAGALTFNGGTLQLGSSLNLGSGRAITLNAPGGTIDTQAFNSVLGQGMTGAGAFTKAGNGTLTLAGTNTYTGGTTISAGTLQLGNGGTSGSILGDVANSGTLVFNRSDSTAFNGVISGAGAVQQIGAGTTTLTGTNTYTGGTTISAGTLQIGNGGASGSITGDVVDNGTLAFNRADNIAFDGVISGAGTLEQRGSGTTALTGANTYTGGTTITAGTLQIGNGGTAGSILGNVTNNDTLAFNRSDDTTFGGVISGTGAVQKFGTGVLTLTGTNSYGGATTVSAGTLLVNGDQTAATGLTSVLSGATLGGTGIIGGDVTIANGATLAPGVPGTTPGTLTINGALALNQDSTLAYRFGEANVPGGALNDLTNVKGNLTLDGKINVALTPGGNFGPGIYRVINYGGTLTNNGLDIGTLPAGTTPGSIYVQTSVAGQVNLANTSGLTLNYWDAKGDKNNNAVDGGTGSWQKVGGLDNWANDTGAVNAPWQNNAFAIFQATPGTVTVDNSTGQVSAAGMQFATDGYIVTGGPLTLGGGTSSIIRVGDGTAAGAGMTATISAVLQGSTQLDKTDAGTLVLTGANTYTGGTAIDGGVLQVAGDSNLGAANGGLTFNGGTLQLGSSFDLGSGRTITLNAPGGTIDTQTFTSTLAQGMTGAGAFTKAGNGTLTLTGSNSYAGGTTIAAGTLQLGNGGASGSITGNVVDNGTLVFNRSDSTAFNGVISGAGAVQQIGTGTTTLTGTNTYTGGTTITAGTLQLGNGGTSGSITGNVANNGTLAFNRSDDTTFGGVISGTGAVQKFGTGVLALTGTNSYGGATSVNAGTLLVNGDQTAAKGLTSVLSGATLGGTGIIGGDVTIANGATLAPGVPGATPGMLTINGALALNQDSTLAYRFGQADVAGGARNDLTEVKGNLTLDGKINVALTPGGNFGPGTYRVFNYGGTLTDNVLDIGTLPAGTAPGSVFVQTSVSGQVNLVNTQGLQLTYWDADGARNNNKVDGGTGTWENTGSLNNWTSPTGAVNAAWAPNGFAIFQAKPGTVTVDNGNGQVSASGMQFDSDGYLVQGDNLTLAGGASSIIRVGNGTSTGAGVTATISAVLQGATQLDKTDLGTLVLTGTNTYTGGTAIDGGVLQVAGDGNLGAANGGLTFNGGTLRLASSFDVNSGRAVVLNAPGGMIDTQTFTSTLAQGMTGAGAFTKAGTGTLTLTGSNSYAGGTTISAGTLQVGSGGTSGSILGNVVDNGTLAFNRFDNIAFGGVVSGSGTLEQRGRGTTTLTGTNTYTGGTTISAGTLQLGNGGTSGSILGNVTNNSTLAFNRSDNISFGGVISGTGSVQQIGSGITTLSGTNTYNGTTTVAAGTLLVNGDQSGAAGATSVASGATIGGTGIIGGNVSIADGGKLAPGLPGANPGTLTINGSLALSQGSELGYRFGQSNVPGGLLNDLTSVKGDLTLDGTINVALTPGGTFDPGVYRVLDYGGTLTNNGLDIGTLPAGTKPGSVFVQTSVAGQVNLANASSMSLNFWDATGAKNNSAVNGGSGIWQNTGTLDNWTNDTGAINARWQDKAFAVFTAKPGTVSVDNINGQVSAAGMQFASDGYMVTGNPLTLAGGATSIIRVGDGSSVGAGFTATIDSVLQGSTQLQKTDLGTLVLNGDNTYTGGTAINGGTLQISKDGNLGTAGSGLSFAGGTLRLASSFDIDGARDIVLNAPGGTIDTQTFDSTLKQGMTGAGSFAKEGKGTLTLLGESDYTGGTKIAGGTLQLGNGGTSGSILGDVANNGALVFNRSDNVAFGGVISGTGALAQSGAGSTILSGANTYTGATTVNTGTLAAAAANTFSAASAVSVLSGARLDLQGHDQKIAGLSNAGVVALGGTASTTLTIAGNYVGNGGTLLFSTYLGDDNSPTDRVIIHGDTSGSSQVKVINRNGPGLKTGEGIRLIQVGGASNGQFRLLGDYTYKGDPSVVAGAYAYRLFQGGTSTPDDGDWYLRSELAAGGGGPSKQFNPSVPVLETYPQQLLAMNSLPTLQQRVGNRLWVNGTGGQTSTTGNPQIEGQGIWARVEGTQGRFKPDLSTSNARYDFTMTRMQAGLDIPLARRKTGQLIGGVTVHYANGRSDVTSPSGNGGISTDGYGVGGTLTWYGTNGFYVDSQAQVTRYDSTLSSTTANRTIAKGNRGSGYAFSLETGQKLGVGDGFTLTPQAQISYSRVKFDSFTDPFDTAVHLKNGDSLRGRLGVSLDHNNSWIASDGTISRTHIYGLANLLYEFGKGSTVNVASVDFSSRPKRLWAEIGTGVSYNWGGDKFSVYGQATVGTSLDHVGASRSFNGTVGFRMRW